MKDLDEDLKDEKKLNKRLTAEVKKLKDELSKNSILSST
jgi:hypothetical protein